jgi:formamidopyrimidine-DNA glycosylase
MATVSGGSLKSLSLNIVKSESAINPILTVIMEGVMPELPEVETIRIGLNRLLPGLVISAVDCPNPKSFVAIPKQVSSYLLGAKVLSVSRRAKVLLIELSTKHSLIIHLKMTGQLVFQGTDIHFGAGHPSKSLISQLPDKSTRVIFSFLGGSKLYFNDQRKFGWVRLLPSKEVYSIKFMQKLGPEPLEADFTWQVLKSQLSRRPNTNIKAALLDQTVAAGVGNIYADESLWGAKIHPLRLVRSLSDTNLKALQTALVAVLRISIEKGGSTDRNYVDADGNKGSYLAFANVFRRNGQHCSRCGTEIIKIRVAGRGTHLCPHCQKLPRALKKVTIYK